MKTYKSLALFAILLPRKISSTYDVRITAQ